MYRDAYRSDRRGGARSGYREPYLDRTEAYYQGSRQGPAQRGGFQKQRSQSSRTYKKEKEEKFRKEKGTEVVSAYQADLKKSLLCGFESMEEVMRAKEYEDTSRSVAVPVSTRAVGVSVTNTYNKATSTDANRQRLPPTTIFQIYRVMLAMVEKKIYDNRILANLDDRDEWYDPIEFETFKQTITSINVCPQQIGALLRCVSNFKYDEVNFVPLFPAPKADNRRRYIPIPEVIYLTNLRATVVSLSNPQVLVATRRNFMNKNSIPGARFNEAAVLLNPDEICVFHFTTFW